MAGSNKPKKSTKSPFQSFLEGFLDFCRKLGPSRAGIDTNRLRQLSFDTLRLIGNRQKKMEEINYDASTIIKQNLNDVKGLLEFIERRGTLVITHKNSDKVLQFFGEIEGFLPPSKGFKTKLLLIGLKLIGAWKYPISNEAPAMFVFSSKEPPMGYVIHQLHHWLSYNKGLPGYTEETVNNFKKIFDPTFGVEDVQRMSRDEIIALREAIARDQEALDFVQKMAQELFKPQDVVKGIKEGDKKNI